MLLMSSTSSQARFRLEIAVLHSLTQRSKTESRRLPRVILGNPKLTFLAVLILAVLRIYLFD